ncbi:G5 domain-containing protein [Staphylococcus aureus]|nr:G5 domain-containing protein [Staphylococcus aureus]
MIKYGPVMGTPETKTVEIPFETKREFNPKLKPGEGRVKQKDSRGVRQ